MDSDVGARIRSVREAAGLRAQELGARVGLDPTAISKIETGKRALKSTELARIAEALGVSVLALLDADPLLTNLTIAARQGPETASTDSAPAFSYVVNLAELHSVLAGGGIHTSPLLAQVPDVRGLTWLAGAKQLASWATRELNLSDVPGEARFEALADAIQNQLRVDVLVRPFPHDALNGAAITDRSFPLVFVNGHYPSPRSLFTLAHELGHLLAGHNGTSVTLDRDMASTDNGERLANAFAAELLMPEDEVQRTVQVFGRTTAAPLVVLMARFGVSYESLVYRLHNLRIINAEGRDRFRAIGWQDLLAEQGPERSGLKDRDIAYLLTRSTSGPASRRPSWLTERALEGYRKGLVSVRPVASLLEEDDDDFLDAFQADAGALERARAVVQGSFPGDLSVSDEVAFGGNPVE